LKTQYKYKAKLGTIFLIAFLLGSIITYTIAQTTNTFIISSGIYPHATSYTIWKEGSLYYAKNAYGAIDFSGTNITAIIENSNNALTSGGTIYVKDFVVPINIGNVLSNNVNLIESYQGRLREYTYEGIKMQPFKTFTPSMRVVSTNNVTTVQPHITNPKAIHYVKTYNRIYYTWLKGSPDWDIYVKYYDWEEGEYSEEVNVCNSPISNEHGAPAIIIDDEGYIHLFYDAWHTDLLYRRSTNTEDITSWSSASVIADYATYPNARIITVNNIRRIYVFYRSGTSTYSMLEKFIYSEDCGVNWSSPTTFIDFTDIGNPSEDDRVYHGTYVITESLPTNKITVDWNWYDLSATLYKNVYYAYSNDGGLTWYSIDDTDLGAVISGTEANTNCKAYNSGSLWCNTQAHTLDGNGFPAIVFKNSTTITSNDMTWSFVEWNGTNWSISVIKNYSIGISGFHAVTFWISQDIFTVIGTDQYHLTMWSTTDRGVNWIKDKRYEMDEQVADGHYPRPWKIYNCKLHNKVVWTSQLDIALLTNLFEG